MAHTYLRHLFGRAIRLEKAAGHVFILLLNVDFDTDNALLSTCSTRALRITVVRCLIGFLCYLVVIHSVFDSQAYAFCLCRFSADIVVIGVHSSTWKWLVALHQVL
jgi:hypothetical protein